MCVVKLSAIDGFSPVGWAGVFTLQLVMFQAMRETWLIALLTFVGDISRLGMTSRSLIFTIKFIDSMTIPLMQ